MGKDQWAKKASGLSVPASQVTRFTRAASLLPDVKVAVGHVTALSIVVSLSRLNAVVEREARIYAPEFPKPQTEGWFVIVGNLATDQVFAVKRVSWSAGGGRGVGVGSKPSARAVIKLPRASGRRGAEGGRYGGQRWLCWSGVQGARRGDTGSANG